MITKCMLKSLIANIFLTTIKIVFGLISKSKTLIADGVHSLSDAATDIIGLVGSKIASKEPDENHPYGHGKAEYITSLFISILILFLAYKIFVNSFNKTQSEVEYYILIISAVTIGLKFLVSRYLIKKGIELNSQILKTSGTESKFDCISGAVALIFITLSFFSQDYPILKYADTIGSIVISLFTLKIGLSFFIENFNSSIGEVDLNKGKLIEIKGIIKEHKQIKTIRRVTILKYGSYSSVIIDIELSKSLTIGTLYNIEKDIKTKLKQLHPEYKYVNINVRPYKIEDKINKTK